MDMVIHRNSTNVFLIERHPPCTASASVKLPEMQFLDDLSSLTGELDDTCGTPNSTALQWSSTFGKIII